MQLCASLELALFVFLIVSCEATTPTGKWRVARSVVQREKPSMVCVANDTIMTVGGVTMDGNVNDVWLFNTKTHLWKQVFTFGDLPRLNAARIVNVGEHQYLYGGQFTGFFGEASGEIYKLDIFDENPVWETIDLGNQVAPLRRYRHGMVALDDETFVAAFGISSATIFGDVWQFNVTSLKWKLLAEHQEDASYPVRRYNPSCHANPAKPKSMICFGGTGFDGDLNDLWEFDATTNRWTLQNDGKGPTTPTPRRLVQAQIVQKRYLMLYSGFSTDFGPIDDGTVFAYDTQTFVWRIHGNSMAHWEEPPPRSGGEMMTCDESTPPYVFFGTNETHNFNDVWQLQKDVFAKIQPDSEIPGPRAQHVTAVVGERIFSFFGKIIDGAMATDVWSFDTNTELWRLEPTESPYEGRLDATAVGIGPFVWIFGGETATGDLVNEMIIYDTVSRTWQVADAPVYLPNPRARHSCVATLSHIVIFGGQTVENDRNNDAAIYSLTERRWFPLIPKPDTPMPPARRQHGMIFDPNTEEIIIAGGDGGLKYLLDRWTMLRPEIASTDPREYHVEYVQRASDIGPNETPRGFIRAQGVFTGVQGNVFVAGGGIGTLFPPRLEDSFYWWNNRTGLNVRQPAMPITTYSMTGGYFRRSVYVFGGYLMRDVKIPRQTNQMQIFEFPKELACNVFNWTHPTQPVKNSIDCLACSPGTIDTDCESVPPGYFKESMYTPPEACGPGTYSVMPAAHHPSTCHLCPYGEYNTLEAQTQCQQCPANYSCLIGAVRPLSAVDNIGIKNEVYQVQPEKYEEDVRLPLFEMATALGAFGIVFSIVCLYLDRRYRSRFEAHYISDKARRKIVRVFRKYTFDTLFLEEKALIRALQDEFKTTDTFCEDAAKRALTIYREKFGIKRITEKKFIDIVILMVGGRYLEPFTDTPFAWGQRFTPPFVVLDLRDMDFFKYRHREFLGHSITRRKTSLGGVVTLGFYFALFVYLTLQITQYRFASVVETRSILPTLVEPLTPYNSFEVEVSVDSAPDACLAVDGESCAEGTIVTDLSKTILSYDASTSRGFSCRKEGRQTCIMRWWCDKCTLTAPNNTLEYYFGSKRAYSSRTQVRVRTGTGIEGQFSEATHVFTVPHPQLLYRGYPSSVVTANVLKTQYTNEISYGVPAKTVNEGFHVGFSKDDKIDGNFVLARTFQLYTGLPVTVALTVDDNTLSVDRRLRQSLLDLLAALLGGISGISGGIIIAMRSLEFVSDSARMRQLKKRLAAQQPRILARQAAEKAVKGDEMEEFLLGSPKMDREGNRTVDEHVSRLLGDEAAVAELNKYEEGVDEDESSDDDDPQAKNAVLDSELLTDSFSRRPSGRRKSSTDRRSSMGQETSETGFVNSMKNFMTAPLAMAGMPSFRKRKVRKEKAAQVTPMYRESVAMSFTLQDMR